MTPKLWIPVYKDTQDKRIHEFANWNFAQHELATGTSRCIPKEWELDNQFKQVPLGNGRIRGTLKALPIAALTIALLMAIYWIGA